MRLDVLILSTVLAASLAIPTISTTNDRSNAPTLNVMSYGAVSDALSVRDGSMTTGSAVLFSPSGLFVSTAVGKTISVQGAGPGGTQLTTVISRYMDARHVVLAKAASGNTVSGAIDESGLVLNKPGSSGYDSGQYETTTSGAGAGATVSIVANGGVIVGATSTPIVVSPGSGYATGDKVYPKVPESDGTAYFQVKKVDGAGVIWGTDNYSAFNNAMSAAAGRHLIIPVGNYLIDTAQGKKAIQVASNTDVDMDRNGILFWVGVQNTNESSNGWSLFNLANGVTNVHFSGIHCVGENIVGLRFAMNNPGCIVLGTGLSHIRIQNSTFTNSFGHAIEGQSTSGNDIVITGNTFIHNNDTGVNVNTGQTTISHNTFIDDPGIEAAGDLSHYDNNILTNPIGGPTALAAGGITAGQPYQGGTVNGNEIINPASTAAIAVLSGFSHGVISNNKVQGYSGSHFCIEAIYTGYVGVDYNTFANNSCSGTGKATLHFNGVKGTKLQNNAELGKPQFGLITYSSTEFDSRGNTLTGRINDIYLSNSSSGRFRDTLAHNSKNFKNGSSVSPDSQLEAAHH